jgi:hypothetical protein
MWRQVVRSGASPDAALATVQDDDQVIVVIDSATGELRQCGDLSGFCIALNPWRNVGVRAPAALLKHAEQLDREQAAQAGQGAEP